MVLIILFFHKLDILITHGPVIYLIVVIFVMHFRLPFSFVTSDVADVTCQCLLAQAEEAEKGNYSKAATEVLILEEFGRCLRKIIEYAHKTKVGCCLLYRAIGVSRISLNSNLKT